MFEFLKLYLLESLRFKSINSTTGTECQSFCLKAGGRIIFWDLCWNLRKFCLGNLPTTNNINELAYFIQTALTTRIASEIDFCKPGDSSCSKDYAVVHFGVSYSFAKRQWQNDYDESCVNDSFWNQKSTDNPIQPQMNDIIGKLWF